MTDPSATALAQVGKPGDPVQSDRPEMTGDAGLKSGVGGGGGGGRG